jgi:hypothetical protein
LKPVAKLGSPAVVQNVAQIFLVEGVAVDATGGGFNSKHLVADLQFISCVGPSDDTTALGTN